MDMKGCVRFVCVSRSGLFSFVPITKTVPWFRLFGVDDQPADLIYLYSSPEHHPPSLLVGSTLFRLVLFKQMR